MHLINVAVQHFMIHTSKKSKAALINVMEPEPRGRRPRKTRK